MNPTLEPSSNLPSIQPAPRLLVAHRVQGYALSESAFLEAIRQERRRSERSGRPFLLMLAKLQTLPSNGARIGAIRKLVSTVRGCVRETDTVGWYRQNQVLGVIFTELGDADQGTVLASLNLRAINKIDNSSHDVKNLSLSYTFHFFPEGTEPNGQAMDFKLYPELSRETWLRKVARGIKRGIDLLGSILAVALLCGLLLVVAALIKLTSKGPILFRQIRIGQHGKAFTFLKFRSMYVNNDATIHKDYVTRFIAGRAELNASAGGPGVYKITNDPRVTPLGRFLRKTSLDELPQLLNVLRGEMSLIG
ncbi:MAG TPA: sugar transferase, partial [Blastocatellia bacterium]|nr:sugar transferase [Blastocatellia bacterium]